MPGSAPAPRHAGVVVAWDERGGYGTVRRDDTGDEHFFHCTQIVDGSRTAEVGERVAFDVEPGRLGRWEATNIVKGHAGQPASPMATD